MSENLPILLASDHAGYALKEKVKAALLNDGLEVQDLGAHSTESVDYPDMANALCHAMKPHQMGVLLCGSGIGISIAANRHNHVRAALVHNAQTAQLARQHNNANVLVLGARTVDEAENLAALDAFLNTKFEGGRHQARVEKLS